MSATTTANTPNQPTQAQANPQEGKTPSPAAASTDAKGVNAQPQAGDPTKSAAKEAMRKLKIDDQEVDEDEVIKIYKERKGHQRAAAKEMQEAKQAKKERDEFLNMLKDKNKLFSAMEKLGHNPRSLAEELLAAKLEEDLLDPREKEFRTVKAELEREKAEKAARLKAEEDHRDAEMRAKFSKDFSEKFVEALKESRLPGNKAMVGRIASYIHRSAKIGFEMTPQEAAKLVRQDIEDSQRNLYGDADAETLFQLLGESNLQKIRAYDTSRLKSPEAHLKTPAEQPGDRARARSTSTRMTPKEWREFNKK
jgi:hypothetical protein